VSDSVKVVSKEWGRLSWSEWIPLNAAADRYREFISDQPGLYRVRSTDLPHLVYKGIAELSDRALTASLNP